MVTCTVTIGFASVATYAGGMCHAVNIRTINQMLENIINKFMQKDAWNLDKWLNLQLFAVQVVL